MQRFAAECILAPAISSTGSEDPQSNQIRRHIEALRSQLGGGKLRILDYGAGRGRILASLRESPHFECDIDYRAYEAHAPDDVRAECAKAIADAHGLSIEDARKRVYESKQTLEKQLNENSVHVVVMCNVLHEISPREWLDCFSMLYKLLHADGYLLIIEDMHIPHGEHAHEHGFILLDTHELQKLFGAKPESGSLIEDSDPKRPDRLKAHLVSAKLLSNVSRETICAALDCRVNSAGAKIAELRKPTASKPFAAGQLLALYTMLYANASLALASYMK